MLPSRPHQDLQRTTLQALRRTHGCRKWLKLDLRRTHDGPKMAPRWPRIAPNVPKMDPRWPHEAPRHTIIKICVLAHKNWGVRSRPCFNKKQPCSALPNFLCDKTYVSSISCHTLTRCKLELRRTHDGPKIAPRWPRDGPRWP